MHSTHQIPPRNMAGAAKTPFRTAKLHIIYIRTHATPREYAKQYNIFTLPSILLTFNVKDCKMGGVFLLLVTLRRNNPHKNICL